MAVAWGMKTLGLLSIVMIAVLGLSQPASGAVPDSAYEYPDQSFYDSCGRVPTVRQVQRALQEDGYYTGDNRGNYCVETRMAVRRYQRDMGLAITGRIDDTLLRTLRLR